MAHPADDDGFHEIQLNGKQLVFLFMAATVVSVVIFLSGVLVGRGVRAERAATDVQAGATEPVPQPAPASPAPAATPGNDPTKAQPPSPPSEDDKLSYPERLTEKKPPREQLTHAAEPAAPPSQAKNPPPANAVSESKHAEPPAPSVAPPPPAASRAISPNDGIDPGGVFAVQVAALNARGEADAIVHRLTTKGYPAYVVPPGDGAVMYRVRVGKYKTRREAEPIATKLQKEEQFKPWITR